jgi:hypothetical protein
MIVVFQGGLGNQMFQYAFGISVAKVKGEEVFFKWRGGPEWRQYSLDPFNCKVNLVQETTGETFGEPVFAFDPAVYTRPIGSSFAGHWQTEKYFTGNAQQVRNDFTLRSPVNDKTKEVAEAIQTAGERGAFLHIRRTDNLIPINIEFHGLTTMEYYKAAIEHIRARQESAKFFVFSDEPEWCKVNFGPEFTVVDHNKMGEGGKPGLEHEDIYLMSLCRHAVIANSTFSWWGAWLGDTQPNRIVIAPQKWFGYAAGLEGKDIVPERWVKLPGLLDRV